MRWGRPRRGCHRGVQRVVFPDHGCSGRQRVGVELLDGELLVAAEDLHLEALGPAHLAVLPLLLRRQLLPLRLPVRWQLQRGNLKMGQVIAFSGPLN